MTAIKKPKSSFLIFYDEQRPAIKAKIPDIKVTDITRECSKQWSALTEEQKDVYKQKYLKEKEQYAARVQAEAETSAVVAVQERAKKSTKKKVHEPPAESSGESSTVGKAKTRGPNGYINFCSAVRSRVKSENPDISPKDIVKKMGEMWNAFSLDEKKAYGVAKDATPGGCGATGSERDVVATPICNTGSTKSVEKVVEQPVVEVASSAKEVKKTRKPRKVAAEPDLS